MASVISPLHSLTPGTAILNECKRLIASTVVQP